MGPRRAISATVRPPPCRSNSRRRSPPAARSAGPTSPDACRHCAAAARASGSSSWRSMPRRAASLAGALDSRRTSGAGGVARSPGSPSSWPARPASSRSSRRRADSAPAGSSGGIGVSWPLASRTRIAGGRREQMRLLARHVGVFSWRSGVTSSSTHRPRPCVAAIRSSPWIKRSLTSDVGRSAPSGRQ